jgi:hypothetical protein
VMRLRVGDEFIPALCGRALDDSVPSCNVGAALQGVLLEDPPAGWPNQGARGGIDCSGTAGCTYHARAANAFDKPGPRHVFLLPS